MLQIASEQLSSTRLEILSYLLVNSNIQDESQGCSIKEMAKTFDLSPNAVRQYLIELEKDKLVVRKKKKGKTGRPAMTYFLHKKALAIFPKSYADFSIRLLNHLLKNYGEEEVRHLLVEMGKEKAEEMKIKLQSKLKADNTNSYSLKDKIKAISNVFQEYGKFPKIVEDGDSFKITNHNCLIYDIVHNHPLACIVDETLVSELVGKKASKVQCLSEGDMLCVYRINKSEKAKI
ncbi:MAG: helix-turn-helix transcriptional regulator [Candidatus Hodarchaeales archaeon]